MSKQGFIILHRSVLDWQWFTDINTSHLFIYCLLRANFKDTKWREIDIKRGQFVSSYNTISVETGLSLQTVRTCFKKLKNSKELTSKATNKFSLITVLNYDKYQSEVTSQLTGNQHSTNKQLTTDNNVNKKNNDNIDARKQKFKNRLNDIWQELKGTEYMGVLDVREFCDYWTEHGDNDKKMRFELQKSFSVKRRLSTWKKNIGKFSNNPQQPLGMDISERDNDFR